MDKIEQQDFYKAGGKKISTEEYNYVDTKDLQIASLQSFAEQLGYFLNPFTHNFSAYSEGIGKHAQKGFKGCSTISFSTMVNLHDSNWTNVTPEYMLVPEFSRIGKLTGWYYEKTFQLDAYTLNKAQACKIVERIYIHCNKKGVLKCYKNQIELTDDAYQQMFLKPLIEKESAQ